MADDIILRWDGSKYIGIDPSTGSQVPLPFDDVETNSLHTEDAFNSAIGDNIDYLNPEWMARTAALLAINEPFTSIDAINTITSGSGTVTLRSPQGDVMISTGATSGSTAELDERISSTNVQSSWDKDRVYAVKAQLLDDVSGRTDYLTTGRPQQNERGFGFKIQSAAVYAVSHDGTTENTTEIIASGNIAANDDVVLMAALDSSAGEVRYYDSGDEVATHTTNVPSGSSSSNRLSHHHVANSTAADRRLLLRSSKVVQAP